MTSCNIVDCDVCIGSFFQEALCQGVTFQKVAVFLFCYTNRRILSDTLHISCHGQSVMS
jgi:hypothetical protein